MLKIFFALLFIMANTVYGMNMNDCQIHVDYQLKEEDADAIIKGLGEFNTPFFGHKKTISFLVSIKDDHQNVMGGVIAWMRPGIKLLWIDIIWVAEPMRNQGLGTQLMLAAEEEGIKQGCIYAQLETLAFQAEEFYKKLGYVQIGHVEKLYGDHDAIYMRKNLLQQ